MCHGKRDYYEQSGVIGRQTVMTEVVLPSRHIVPTEVVLSIAGTLRRKLCIVRPVVSTEVALSVERSILQKLCYRKKDK